MIYRFHFYASIYFKCLEASLSRGGSFPLESYETFGKFEKLGRFVGFMVNVSHAMTYDVLNHDTNKVIWCSCIKLASTMFNVGDDQPSTDIESEGHPINSPPPEVAPTILPPPMPGENKNSIHEFEEGISHTSRCIENSGKTRHIAPIDMDFVPSTAEENVWTLDNSDQYEDIALNVDDLAIVSMEPQTISNISQEKHKLKLKDLGSLSYYLGCNFHQDENSTLCMKSISYIDRLIDNYTRMFGSKPKQNYTSTLEKEDHSELEDSPELEMEEIQKYQSLTGALQWAITFGRLIYVQ